MVALFTYLDQVNLPQHQTEATIKGYRINVSYDAMTTEEMTKKRASVAKVVMNSMKKMKKK